MKPISEIRWELPIETMPHLRWAAVDDFGSFARSFHLPEFWQLHLVHYHADFWMDDQAFTLNPGYVVLTPPGVKTTTVFHSGDTHYYAHFYYDPSESGQTSIRLPAVMDLEDRYLHFDRHFKELVAFDHESRRRAEVQLWNILWRIHDLIGEKDPDQGRGMHPTVGEAIRYIESRITQRISIQDMTRELQISQSHLIRLFRARFDTTIVGYIRQRRMMRAAHMLAHTTKTIKAIAYEVGIPDLHQFNKAVRRAYGCSPRQLREEGGYEVIELPEAFAQASEGN